MPRYLFAAMVVLAVAASFWCGRLTAGGTTQPPLGERPADLRRELSALKEEIAALRIAVTFSAATGQQRAEPCAPSPEPPNLAPRVVEAPDVVDEAPPEAEQDQASLRAGEQLVAASLAHGTWTHREVASFRELTRNAPEVNWGPLRQQVSAAINSGRLQVDLDVHSPF
jgi:hypothetical protein